MQAQSAMSDSHYAAVEALHTARRCFGNPRDHREAVGYALSVMWHVHTATSTLLRTPAYVDEWRAILENTPPRCTTFGEIYQLGLLACQLVECRAVSPNPFHTRALFDVLNALVRRGREPCVASVPVLRAMAIIASNASSGDREYMEGAIGEFRGMSRVDHVSAVLACVADPSLWQAGATPRVHETARVAWEQLNRVALVVAERMRGAEDSVAKQEIVACALVLYDRTDNPLKHMGRPIQVMCARALRETLTPCADVYLWLALQRYLEYCSDEALYVPENVIDSYQHFMAMWNSVCVERDRYYGMERLACNMAFTATLSLLLDQILVIDEESLCMAFSSIICVPSTPAPICEGRRMLRVLRALLSREGGVAACVSVADEQADALRNYEATIARRLLAERVGGQAQLEMIEGVASVSSIMLDNNIEAGPFLDVFAKLLKRSKLTIDDTCRILSCVSHSHAGELFTGDFVVHILSCARAVDAATPEPVITTIVNALADIAGRPATGQLDDDNMRDAIIHVAEFAQGSQSQMAVAGAICNGARPDATRVRYCIPAIRAILLRLATKSASTSIKWIASAMQALALCDTGKALLRTTEVHDALVYMARAAGDEDARLAVASAVAEIARGGSSPIEDTFKTSAMFDALWSLHQQTVRGKREAVLDALLDSGCCEDDDDATDFLAAADANPFAVQLFGSHNPTPITSLFVCYLCFSTQLYRACVMEESPRPAMYICDNNESRCTGVACEHCRSVIVAKGLKCTCNALPRHRDMRRELRWCLNIEVACPHGCGEQVALRDVRNHLRECTALQARAKRVHVQSVAGTSGLGDD